MTTLEQKQIAADLQYKDHNWGPAVKKGAFIEGAEWAEAQVRWIPAEERLPIVGETSKLILIKDENGRRHLGHYFPDRFRTIEFEDWDEYTGEEDFPHTEDDRQNECVWLRAGFYGDMDCDKCDDHSYYHIQARSWMPLPESPAQEDGQDGNNPDHGRQ